MAELKIGDRVVVTDLEPGADRSLVGREGVIVNHFCDVTTTCFDWLVQLDGDNKFDLSSFYGHELQLVGQPEFEFIDWNDGGDRVVDVRFAEGASTTYSAMVDADPRALERRIENTEREARAMLAWVEYVRG